MNSKISDIYRLIPKEVWLFFLIYMLVMGWFVCERHNRLNSAVMDLGSQDQTIWNTSRGNFFKETIHTSDYLGIHFSPTIALFSPIYWFTDSVLVLLLVQTLILASGVIPLWLVTKKILGDKKIFTIIPIAYLFYPPLEFINRYDFHVVCLLIPLFFWIFYLVEIKKFGWASLCIALVILSKEHVGLVISAYGVYLFFRKRYYKFGGTLAAGGFLWTAFAFCFLVPYFRGGGEVSLFTSRYEWMGANPWEWFLYIIQHPLAAYKKVFHDHFSVSLIFKILFPVFFIPVVSSSFILILIPSIVINILSENLCQQTIYYQYTAEMIPIIWISTVFGIKTFQKRFSNSENIVKILFALIILGTTISYIQDNPMTKKIGYPFFPVGGLEKKKSAEYIPLIKEYIPPETPVIMTGSWFPHFSHRPRALYYPFHGDFGAPYFIADISDSEWEPLEPKIYDDLKKIILEYNYKVILREGKLILLSTEKGDDILTKQLLQSLPKMKENYYNSFLKQAEWNPLSKKIYLRDSVGKIKTRDLKGNEKYIQLPPTALLSWAESKMYFLLTDKRIISEDKTYSVNIPESIQPESVADFYVKDASDITLCTIEGDLWKYNGDWNVNKLPPHYAPIKSFEYTGEDDKFIYLNCNGGIFATDGFELNYGGPNFGWDIARYLTYDRKTGGVWVLDGYGGIHGNRDILSNVYVSDEKMIALLQISSTKFILVDKSGSTYPAYLNTFFTNIAFSLYP